MIEQYVCPSCEKSIDWDDSSCEEFVICPSCSNQFKSPNAPMFLKGTVVGDYVIEKRLGIGGMGEVYLAEQKSMLRPVALKVLQPELVEDNSYLERFYREVRTLAQIQHPNIVNAIETGRQDQICFFSMSYIKGNDLKHRLDNQGAMSEIDALYVILNVAGALKYVWERHKIIHRDIKPANIILTDEHEVKLMDLGISKVVTDDKSGDLTMAGMMVGSPYYISPEQARAEQDIDWRADMYSLGATFYHMIVGELPFDAENAMGIIAAHLSKQIPDPRNKNPKITDRSANIIGQMMQKNKNDRFHSWDDAIEETERAIAELSGNGAETTILTAVPKTELKKEKKPPLKKQLAKSDTIEKVKETVHKTLIGNLYIRFVILVTLLFITFLSFFKVAKESIHEEKIKKVKIKIEHYNQAKSEKINTKTGRTELYAMLANIKKSDIKKARTWADKELKTLQKNAFLQKEQRDNYNIQKDLNKLKSRSYDLEKKREIKKALQVWREYAKNGAFANELQDEIQKAIDYLTHKRRKNKRDVIE